MDAKGGSVIWKLKGWVREGIMMCKLKGGCKRGQYDVQTKTVVG